MGKMIKLPNGECLHPKSMLLDTEELVLLKKLEFDELINCFNSLVSLFKQPNFSQQTITMNCEEALNMMTHRSMTLQEETGTMTSISEELSVSELPIVTDEELAEQKCVAFSEFEKQFAAATLNELAKIRKEQNLTQAKLAEITGLTQPQLSKIEREPENANVKHLIRIAKALNRNISIGPTPST